MKQPEAERLAKELTTAVRQSFEDEQVILVARWFVEDSAAELRRLHKANQAMLEALKLMQVDCQYLHHSKKHQHSLGDPCPVEARIHAAIAKGEQQ